MAAYDICLFEWVYEGGVSLSKFRLKITHFSAAGVLNTLLRGQTIYKHRGAEAILPDDRKAMDEEFRRQEVSLISEGWQKMSGHHSPTTLGDGMFVRPTKDLYEAIMPYGERLQILDEIINSDKGEDKYTATILRSYLEHYGESLEQEISPEEDSIEQMVGFLERISKLHRDGSLSDIQFENAKKRIGL